MSTASYTVNQFALVDERNTALKDLLNEFEWQGEELMRLSLPLMPMIDAIKSLDDLASLDNYRANVVGELKNIKHRGQSLAVSPALLDKLCFIWAAYFDERVGYESELDTTQWQNKTLVSQLFGIRNSGETFFNLIKQLMGSPKKHLALLKVCYVILQLGFKGKYHNHHRAELKQIIMDMHYALSELGALDQAITEQPHRITLLRRRLGLFKGITPLVFWLSVGVILLCGLASYNHYLGEIYQQQDLEYQQMADDTYQHIQKLQPQKMYMENTQFFEQATYPIDAEADIAPSRKLLSDMTSPMIAPAALLEDKSEHTHLSDLHDPTAQSMSEPEVQYLVQIGAFNNMERAEKLHNSCTNSQYPLQIIQRQARQFVGYVATGFAQAKVASDYLTERCNINPYIKKISE